MDSNTVNMAAKPIEKTVNLRFLLAYLFKKGRSVLLTAVLLAIAVTIFNSLMLIPKFNDKDFMDASLNIYNKRLSAYRDNIDALEFKNDVISDNLNRETEYNNSSLLMKMDPYRKAVTTLIYYVDFDYQIIPENTYQNIDYSSRLTKLYQSYLTGGEMYSQLMALFPGISDTQYIKELLSVSVDEMTSIITIRIYGDSDIILQAVDAIKAGMQATYTKASELVAEHQLSMIGESRNTLADMSLAQLQQNNLTAIHTLSVGLQENIELLKEMKANGEPEWEYSWQRITRSFLKYAIFAGALGFMLALLYFAVIYIVSDTIIDVDKLCACTGINLLGTVPKETPTRKRWFQTIAGRLIGVKQQLYTREKALIVMARSIRASVSAAGIAQGDIALAGSIAIAALQEIADVFNAVDPDSPLRFVAAGDPLYNEDIVNILLPAQIVVLVERQDVSLCSSLIQAYNRIAAWGKQMLGTVLLDTDIL